MTQTLGAVPVTAASWTNLVAAYSAAANVDVQVQNKGGYATEIVWGGADPGASGSGEILNPGDAYRGNAAAIWVRGLGSVVVTAL